MSARSKALGLRLSALHAASFVAIGVYLPFFPVWLESKALSPAAIGIVVAIPVIVRILVTAPLLALADRTVGPRRLLTASHLGQLLGYPVLMLADSVYVIACLVAVLAVFQACVIPGNDLVTTNAVRHHQGLNYGRIRSFGSITFLLASIAAGYLVDAWGAGVLLWALALAPAVGIAATRLAVPAGEPREIRVEEAGAPSAPVRLPRTLWLVMIAAALVQGSHSGLYAFGSIHWRSIGFSDTVIGYFWAIGVVAEIAVFYVLGRGVGHGSAGLGLLLLGGAASTLRFALLSTDPGLAATFVLQALHGLSFGAAHLGTMAAVAALAPDAGRGRAQGILASLLALGGASAMIVSGEIYRTIGAGLFAVMAPLSALACLLTLLAMRRQARHG